MKKIINTKKFEATAWKNKLCSEFIEDFEISDIKIFYFPLKNITDMLICFNYNDLQLFSTTDYSSDMSTRYLLDRIEHEIDRFNVFKNEDSASYLHHHCCLLSAYQDTQLLKCDNFSDIYSYLVEKGLSFEDIIHEFNKSSNIRVYLSSYKKN